MSKMYIPEIGDVILLEEDWNINIIPEHRNISILKKFGYNIANDRYIVSDSINSPEPPSFIVPSNEEISKSKSIFESWNVAKNRVLNSAAENYYKSEEYINYINNLNDYNKLIEKIGLKNIQLTIPQGTELKIDRIYIRKNNSDYSSVSFWVTFKSDKKKYRFFVSLNDVNKMYYEKY